MTTKYFIIEQKQFNKRTLTELQHKLRVVLKCYTVTGFRLNEEDKTFVFKKSYRIKKIRMDDPKDYSGFYSIEDNGDGKYLLKISVN